MQYLLFLIVILITMIAPVQAQDNSLTVHFPSLDKKEGTAIQLSGTWFRSALPGKRASVIALHGCGGLYSTKKKHEGEFNARHKSMAELLQSAGYNVLFVDSFTPRGVRSICTSKYNMRDITTHTRRLDVQGALTWVATQAEVDPTRIALLGWSNGGSTTLNSLNKYHKDGLVLNPRLKAAVAFYPGCASYLKAKSYGLDTPLLILIGASDDWTPAKPCVELEKKLQPAPITVRVYPDSYHDFDAPNLPIKLRTDVPNGVNPGAGVTTGSNPVAKEAAYKEMLIFLAQQLH